ncbi:putative allergen Asp F4-like [Aspergillus affinis]|uniref:putative allergen Asp F4-like n=1 Tax=Aspergillus affinis TaxID=1070780 RepID=UPI0022FDE833|nr:uncharacterized protein KD926_010959 [Aspergillus affinis]KAI9038303.1 hypothetical protein KD926_010959 [Aspergillus affinis]
MQWRSFLLVIYVAQTALGRSHIHHRRHNHHQYVDLHEPEAKAELEARQIVNFDAAVKVKTILDLEIVTLTTIIAQVPTEIPTTSTVTSVVSETAVPETNEDTAQPLLSASIDIGIDAHNIIPHHTTTATAAATTSTSTESSDSWTTHPSNNQFSTTGFGARTNSTGTGVKYTGNVGSPWGSNILEVSAASAHQYKYVVQFTHSSSSDWTVVVWNKIGPDGEMTGWYGNSAVNFTLSAGEKRYVAFDEDSQGAWGAAEGTSLPTDEYGGYSCTWGEFDFGDYKNDYWSGWDVSAIQAQNAGQTVQGMSICEYGDTKCSSITTGAGKVVNAYESAQASIDGIGGSVGQGAVRLVTVLDYSG